MQGMSTDEMREHNHHNHHHRHHSDAEIASSERVPYSGPLSGPLNKRPAAGKKSARFNVPAATEVGGSSGNGEAYVEITLDLREDSVAVQSVKAANGEDLGEDPELTLLAKGLEKKSTSSVVRNASARFRQVSQELKRLASFSKKPAPAPRFDRTKSAAAHALKGLKFISKTDGGAGWAAVEKRFDELTASSDGNLHRSQFGECIGILLTVTTLFLEHNCNKNIDALVLLS